MPTVRLNRYLAGCGLGSRRAVEQLVREGAVSLNGRIIEDLATQVDPAADQVLVRGKAVRPATGFEYILLNKPRGYDVTRGGQHHHRRAHDLLPKDVHPAVQSAGRLDRDSTGLLLFTNDGELAFRMTHPRYGCRKVYEVEVSGELGRTVLEQLRAGVELEDGPARPAEADILPGGVAGQSRLRIVMTEGRNRIVRRLCEAVGHPVLELHRTAVGLLTVGDLRLGKTRPLTPREVSELRRSLGLTAPSPAPATNRDRSAPEGEKGPKRPPNRRRGRL